jgi:hypothetical protein
VGITVVSREVPEEKWPVTRDNIIIIIIIKFSFIKVLVQQ